MAELAPLSFPLLKLINESRSTYGLRHQDFPRYKAHCTTKLARLRKSVGLSQVSGKAKKYTRKDVDPIHHVFERHLHVLLFNCERLWAASHVLQSGETARSAHRSHQKLSRAVQQTDALLALTAHPRVVDRLSLSHRAQTTIYHLLLRGTLAFERGAHEEGVKVLGVAWTLCHTVSSKAETAEEEALVNEVIDEVEPMLRFCAYTLQRDVEGGVGEVARGAADEFGETVLKGWKALVGALEEGEGREREAVEIVWRGKELPVRNVQLVDVVGKVQSALKSLEKDDTGKGKDMLGARRMGTFDRVLGALTDGEGVARQLVEDNQIASTRTTSARFAASAAPLQQAHSYILYHLLAVRTKRDLLLISTTLSKLAAREYKATASEAAYVLQTGKRDPKVLETKLRKARGKVYPGLVRIYDGVIRSLEQMRDLDIVENDGDLAALVEARIAFISACRCKYLARTYALLSSYPSSLTLLNRAKLYTRQSRASLPLSPESYPLEVDYIEGSLPLDEAALDAFDLALEGDYTEVSQEWTKQTGGVGVEDVSMEGLSLEGEKGGKKTKFYDVAFSYVGAFDLEAISRRAAASVPAPQLYTHHPPTHPSPAMGASQSVPLASARPQTPQPTRAQAADALLSSISLRSQYSTSTASSKGPATASLTLHRIDEWDAAYEGNAQHRLAGTVLSKQDFTVALTSRKAATRDVQVFNTKLSAESTTVTNQKSSGRCWLFATLNTIRLGMAQKYQVEGLELSQAYLFFFDALEKANYFLENMLDLAQEPLDSREIQFLMTAPMNNGGQWDMVVNLINTYGLVPQSIFPESFHSSNTAKLGALITSKLRDYTLELRALHAATARQLSEADAKGRSREEIDARAKQAARKRKEQMMEEVYRILAITLGTPPKANEPFVWEYYSKDKKFHSLTCTPVEFYQRSGADVSAQISLINDPRNAYDQLYTVSRLGNVWGGRPVLYVNTEVQNLKDVAIQLLKADIAVWFGCDVGKASNSALGIMDTDLYDYEGAFGTSIQLTKAERLSTGDSSMTHAMVLTAVHLDTNGAPVRWRVENSWGKDACTDGYFLMSDDWFSEHVFQIVAPRSRVPAHLVKVFETGVASVLPPWDPMGSLA